MSTISETIRELELKAQKAEGYKRVLEENEEKLKQAIQILQSMTSYGFKFKNEKAATDYKIPEAIEKVVSKIYDEVILSDKEASTAIISHYLEDAGLQCHSLNLQKVRITLRSLPMVLETTRGRKTFFTKDVDKSNGSSKEELLKMLPKTFRFTT